MGRGMNEKCTLQSLINTKCWSLDAVFKLD